MKKNLTSEILSSAELAPLADAACIRLLSLSCILSRLMSELIPEYRGISPDLITEKYLSNKISTSTDPVHRNDLLIESEATEDKSSTEGIARFDIRFTAKAPQGDELIELIINIEAQNKFNPGYSIIRRGIYYCSRLISQQRGITFRNNEYDRIRKAYSIWICTSVPKKYEGSITSYRLREERIAGSFSAEYNDYDLMCMLAVCPPSDGKDSEGVLRLLGVLLSENCKIEEKKEVLNKEFGIPLEESVEGDTGIMCNWSAGVIEKTVLKNIKNLIKNSNLTEEKAMEILEIPPEERKKYSEMIREGF